MTIQGIKNSLKINSLKKISEKKTYFLNFYRFFFNDNKDKKSKMNEKIEY